LWDDCSDLPPKSARTQDYSLILIKNVRISLKEGLLGLVMYHHYSHFKNLKMTEKEKTEFERKYFKTIHVSTFTYSVVFVCLHRNMEL